MKKVKVCGMKNSDNIRDVAGLKPDFMGFIFYEGSPRFVSELDVLDFRIGIKKVGVFVNASLDYIEDVCKKYDINTVQLHGGETPEFCEILKENKYSIIKSISVGSHDDIIEARDFSEVADFILFDTKTKGFGGSGKKFDWEFLEGYNLDVPFFISGGIKYDDIERIKRIGNRKFYGVDINSGFEKSVGFKDVELIKRFLENYYE